MNSNGMVTGLSILPKTKEGANRFWIAVAILILLPVIPFLWGNLYFTPDAYGRSFEPALVLGTVVCIALAVYIRHLFRLGINSATTPAGIGELILGCLSALFFVYLSAYGYVVASHSLSLAGRKAQDYPVKVDEVRQCTTKCRGCTYRARVKEWPGQSGAELCVSKNVWDVLKPGDELMLHGYFSEHAIYLLSMTKM